MQMQTAGANVFRQLDSMATELRHERSLREAALESARRSLRQRERLLVQLQEARAVAAKALAASQASCSTADSVKACARIQELVHTLDAEVEEPSTMSGAEVLDETWVSEEVKIPRSVPHFHIGDDSVLDAEGIDAVAVKEDAQHAISAALIETAEAASKSDDASTSDSDGNGLNCHSPSSSSNSDLADEITASGKSSVMNPDRASDKEVISVMVEHIEGDLSESFGQPATPCSLDLVAAAPASPIKRCDTGQSRVQTESARWQPNTSDCSICKVTFSIFNMRHHCRRCGRNICAACSPFRMALDAPLQQPATPLQRLIDTAVQRALTPSGVRRTESATASALPPRPSRESKRRHRASSADRAQNRARRSGSRERSMEHPQAHRVCSDCHSQSLALSKTPINSFASMRKGKARAAPASPSGLSMNFSMRLAFGGA
eukprot:TRINITY_DN27547_c0_g1_i1.p1 TRINITY_DN27547_c0_g1~~TRINITY_DN27547_c0_g1_i1.p1  ORF type:complete len:435 (+),score=79.92 TRINITY_DN27547_c0_g1_i1:70-1374(+)